MISRICYRCVVVAFGPVSWAWLDCVLALDDVGDTTIQIEVSKPLFTAATESFEEVHSLEIDVIGHPFWKISAVHACTSIQIRVISARK